MNDLSCANGSENLLPRRYQEEVFARAQQGNIIAALDTGSGKTFISTLLIRSISAVQCTPRKVVIFLVPKVSLVEQQGDFIATQTPLRVCKLHGTMDIDLTHRSAWKRKFFAHDVFVMTGMSRWETACDR
jgi:endoribonuclease Dicer